MHLKLLNRLKIFTTTYQRHYQVRIGGSSLYPQGKGRLFIVKETFGSLMSIEAMIINLLFLYFLIRLKRHFAVEYRLVLNYFHFSSIFGHLKDNIEVTTTQFNRIFSFYLFYFLFPKSINMDNYRNQPEFKYSFTFTDPDVPHNAFVAN